MIMIIGSTHDDILYFSSIMTGKREETVLEKFHVEIGQIFNQEVLLVENVFTNYMSSAVTMYLIQKYYVFLCFNVGRCLAYSKDWKLGEIAISGRTYTGDVNQTSETDAMLGQIPGCPPFFASQEDIIGYLTESFERRTMAHIYRSTYVSSNNYYSFRKELEDIEGNGTLFGASSRVVLDSTLGGVGFACHLLHVPFIAAKVISGHLDAKRGIDEYALSLGKYAEIGKAVVATIGEIGRKDVLGE